MFDNAAEDEQWRSVISLEDGADEWSCGKQQLDISERGMCFQSRCQFPLGTQLAVTFSCPSKRACTEGIVVGCEELAACCYRITLLFLESPVDLPWQFSNLRHGESAEPGTTSASRWDQPAG